MTEDKNMFNINIALLNDLKFTMKKKINPKNWNGKSNIYYFWWQTKIGKKMQDANSNAIKIIQYSVTVFIHQITHSAVLSKGPVSATPHSPRVTTGGKQYPEKTCNAL